MEDWVKIQSFDRIHQAELRKDLLENNDIQAVVINERDSIFLMGEIKLYVRKEDEKRALALIEEFQGLTKIDSFILRRPIENLKEILDANTIYAVIKTTKNERYMLDNYELYVRNEDVKKTIPFLTGEKLEGWTLLETCIRTRQTRFRIELLAEKNIETIIIKKRDSQFMKAEINIYVKNSDLEIAKQTLTDLIGWIQIETFPMLHRAEIRENLLGKHGIRSIIVKNGEQDYQLFVECNNEEKAIKIINDHRNWKKAATFTTQLEADYAAAFLAKEGIEAVTITRLDKTFLLDVEIYIDDFNIEQALQTINELNNIERD